MIVHDDAHDTPLHLPVVSYCKEVIGIIYFTNLHPH